MASFQNSRSYEPWNKRKLIGQKAPLRLKDIWAIRVRLQLDHKIRVNRPGFPGGSKP